MPVRVSTDQMVGILDPTGVATGYTQIEMGSNEHRPGQSLKGEGPDRAGMWLLRLSLGDHEL
jgi:hypothetical protein